jgi:hypothetical protein
MLPALPLALVLAQSSVPTDDAYCHATNAHYNIVTTPKTGYDYIPVVPDDSQGFYVAYSAKQNADNTDIGGASCIYVMRLVNDEVLIFGGGFGDTWYLDGGAFYDADYDVAHVREAVAGCMGLDPSKTPVHFVAPHGHPDHITVAFIKALERAGMPVASIQYHTGDRAWIEQLPWSTHHYPLLQAIPGKTCGEPILTYESPLGHVWFTWRPGHTPGSIDMVLDVGGDPLDRVLVLGSAPGNACPQPSGTQLVLNAHGTAIIGGPRRALVEPLQGTGINRSCMVSLSQPKLGTTWSATVDVSEHPGAFAVTVSGTDTPLVPTMLTPYGEVLVNQNGRLLINAAVPVLDGNPVLSFAIPQEPLLMGQVIYVQSAILGGGAELCNGLKLTIGF